MPEPFNPYDRPASSITAPKPRKPGLAAQLKQAKALLCYALPEVADAAACADDERERQRLADLANDMREAIGYPRE